MSRDVRIQPTPEPTPTAKPSEASEFSRAKRNTIPAINSIFLSSASPGADIDLLVGIHGDVSSPLIGDVVALLQEKERTN
jgi:hypothetical protein